MNASESIFKVGQAVTLALHNGTERGMIDIIDLHDATVCIRCEDGNTPWFLMSTGYSIINDLAVALTGHEFRITHIEGTPIEQLLSKKVIKKLPSCVMAVGDEVTVSCLDIPENAKVVAIDPERGLVSIENRDGNVARFTFQGQSNLLGQLVGFEPESFYITHVNGLRLDELLMADSTTSA